MSCIHHVLFSYALDNLDGYIRLINRLDMETREYTVTVGKSCIGVWMLVPK